MHTGGTDPGTSKVCINYFMEGPILVLPIRNQYQYFFMEGAILIRPMKYETNNTQYLMEGPILVLPIES